MKRVGSRIYGFALGAAIAGGALALGGCGAQRAKVEAEPPAARQEKPELIKLTVTVDGQFAIDGERVSRDDLQAKLAAIASMHPQPEVHLDSEAGAKYGDFAFAMAAAQRVGLKHFGVIGGT
jgi:biopolymer transport protein ExbD